MLANAVSQQMDANKSTSLAMTPEDFLGIQLDKARESPLIAYELCQIYSGSPLEQAFRNLHSDNKPVSPIAHDMIFGGLGGGSVPPLTFGGLGGGKVSPQPHDNKIEQHGAVGLATDAFGLAKSGWLTASPYFNAPFGQPGTVLMHDGYDVSKVLRALRFAGWQSRMVTTGAQTYIILTGRAGLRDLGLQGTRFLANNPKMIELGLGVKNLANAARGGAVIGCIVSTAIETLDFIFKDDSTVESLVGGIAVEVGKNVVAATLAYALAAAAGGMVASALLPGIVLVVAAFFIGAGLNYLDNSFRIKNAVINVLKEVNAEHLKPGINALANGIHTWAELANMSWQMQMESEMRIQDYVYEHGIFGNR